MSQIERRRLDFGPLFNQSCDVGCSHKKKGNFEPGNSLPEENCVSYFLVAMIKCHNQKQLMEERVYVSLRFQRDSAEWQGRHGSRHLEQDAERAHLQLHIGSRM